MRCFSLVLAALAVAVCAAQAPAKAQAQAAGDPAAGKLVFNRCAPCHSVRAGETRVGPSLFGILGRRSAAAAGYSYSDDLRNLNVTWDATNLNRWIRGSHDMVKVTKEAFPGLPDPVDRANLIAYLATLR